MTGTAYDFTDCFYPTCRPARLWTSPATLDGLDAPPAERGVLVGVDLARGARPSDLIDAVGSAIGDGLLGSTTWDDTRRDLLVEIDFFGAFLAAFGAFVLAGSGVVILGTITSRTVARRADIARLRTIGFTGGQLSGAILVEHLVIAVVAGVAGNALALACAPRLEIGALRTLGSGAVRPHPTAVVTSLATVTAMVVLATLVPAWRAGRIGVATALARTGRAPTRSARLCRPVPIGLGARALTARPLRTVISVTAIALAILTAVVAASINGAVEAIADDPALMGDPGDAMIRMIRAPSDVDPGRVAALLGGLPEVAGWFSVTTDTLTVDRHDVHVRVVGGNVTRTGYVIGGGRQMTNRGEAIGAWGWQQAAGWRLGDTVEAEIGGRRLPDLTLVGWYRDAENTGAIMQVRLDDYRTVAPAAGVDAYIVHASPGVTRGELVAAVEAAFDGRALVTPVAMGGSVFAPFQVAVTTMSVLIGAVAVTHVVSTIATMQRERRRHVGIQRAIGFTAHQVLAESASHGAAIAAWGCIVGLPVAIAAQRVIGDKLTGALGLGPGLTQAPGTDQLALLVCIVIAATAALASLTTGGIARRPVSDLLGSE